MSKSKWIMKQYWRVGTIRALSSLALGMLVLGKLYYVHIPILSDLDLLGALILGGALFFLFLGVGYLYDVKIKMWSPKTQVLTERSIFEYVPNYRNLAFDYPMLNAVLRMIKNIMKKLGRETSRIDESLKYFEIYFNRLPNKKHLQEAERGARAYSEAYPFSRTDDESPTKIGIRARLKLGFETQVLRISWVNSLTGLAQDALVFAAFYIVIIFPDVVVDSAVPVEYMLLGLVFISLPIFVGFVAFGWYYDKKLKVWSAEVAVRIDRNPYSYVPDPKVHGYTFPVYITVFRTLRDIFIKQGYDTTGIDDILHFLDEYKDLTISPEDMERGKELRASFGKVFHGGT